MSETKFNPGNTLLDNWNIAMKDGEVTKNEAVKVFEASQLKLNKSNFSDKIGAIFIDSKMKVDWHLLRRQTLNWKDEIHKKPYNNKIRAKEIRLAVESGVYPKAGAVYTNYDHAREALFHLIKINSGFSSKRYHLEDVKIYENVSLYFADEGVSEECVYDKLPKSDEPIRFYEDCHEDGDCRKRAYECFASLCHYSAFCDFDVLEKDHDEPLLTPREEYQSGDSNSKRSLVDNHGVIQKDKMWKDATNPYNGFLDAGTAFYVYYIPTSSD